MWFARVAHRPLELTHFRVHSHHRYRPHTIYHRRIYDWMYPLTALPSASQPQHTAISYQTSDIEFHSKTGLHANYFLLVQQTAKPARRRAMVSLCSSPSTRYEQRQQYYYHYRLPLVTSSSSPYSASVRECREQYDSERVGREKNC